MKTPIILASSSITRKHLLDRLNLDYQAISPDIDENAQNETHADELAYRLAFSKANIIAQQYPDAIVIGSDQVAWRDGEPSKFIGKPLTPANAIAQLKQNSGKIVHFSTALSVQQLSKNFEHTLVKHYHVKFKNLTDQQIERYIQLENPLFCAGSFKCEGLGISLFESMHGDDFTTLMGLPLISLCTILNNLNISIP